ncbi:hypothetical protein LSM04_003104 [Trypanosoma melophagium]|uniref:uncharacterized protein n=1 Tax=Trypanosoma melophagium TaxID=715481 RepID=UPI00351A751F|nr:hypothetical protein LSM04_003104 [Trypanosoma melophagium]
MMQKREVLPLLEFVCNVRWVFSYALQKLDPVVEAHYLHIIKQVRVAESVFSRSFSTVGSILEVPSEAFTLVQEGVVYLLVAEGVLGHCPPTMHSFLLRATAPGSSVLSTEYTTSSNNSTITHLHSERSEYQAHFLSLRWLIAEGLLTEEELLDALGDGIETSTRGQHSRFDLHVSMAKGMATSTHFPLEAHIAITRSLLLHHCCTLLSVENIITHVRFLDPTCNGELKGMEEALLFWISHVLKEMYRKNILDKRLYNAAKKDLGKSLYDSLQSGVLLGLTVHFYQPKMLPLSNITINSGSNTASRELTREWALHNWGVVLRTAEELGLIPCFFADEVEEYGAVMLQLHVLRFVQELFALLATQAEDLLEAGGSDTVPSFTLSAVSQQGNSETSINAYPSLDKGKDDGVVSDSHVMFSDSPCEEVNKVTESLHNNNNNNNEDDKSDDSYPENSNLASAHSRRQYDVMMTSLHLRGLSVRVTPLRSDGSPLRSRTPAVEGVLPTNSSTTESFPLNIIPKNNIIESVNINEILKKNSITKSKDKPNKDLVEEVKATNSISVVSDHLVSSRIPSGQSDSGSIIVSLVRSNENSSTTSFTERTKDVGNRYASASYPPEKNINTLCNNPITGVDPSYSVKIGTSCTTSECSFHVNSIWRPGASLLSRDERVESIPVIPSDQHSIKPGEIETDSQGISPLTPDIITDHGVMMGERNLYVSFSQQQQQPSSLKSEKEHPPSCPLMDSTMIKEEVKNDISMIDPSNVSIDGDRGALLQALGKQQALIQHLAKKLKEAGVENYSFNSLDKILADDATVSADETLKSTQMLLLSNMNTQTIDSGEFAETDISSTRDDFFEGEGSYLDC